jgi:hypothetical protein
MNPKCADYKKAFTLDGKKHEPKITTKE